PVDRAGQPIGAAGLRVGQHVVIRAMGAPSDLRAARITLLPAVAGPVTAVDVSAHRIDVMHQPVVVSAHTLGTLARDLARIAIGDFVEVHGLRDVSGDIRATRLDPTARSSPVLLAGIAHPGSAGWSIGATRVDAATRLTSGFVRASGRWDAQGQRVVDAKIEPVLPTEPPFTRASVEAFIERPAGDRLSTTVLPIDASRIPKAGAALTAGGRGWGPGGRSPPRAPGAP